jgi:hypothetical protein
MKVGAESANSDLLVCAVQVAELLIAHDFDSRATTRQLLFEYGEQFVASEQVVPEKCHAGTIERFETIGLPPLLDASRGPRPHHVVGWFHADHHARSAGVTGVEFGAPLVRVYRVREMLTSVGLAMMSNTAEYLAPPARRASFCSSSQSASI